MDLIEKQKGDSVVGPVYKAVDIGTRPKKEVWGKLDRKSKVLLQQFSKLRITEDGILRRKTDKYTQIVLPEAYHNLVFLELHQKMGHLAADRVEDFARQRFYWPYRRLINKRAYLEILKKLTFIYQTNRRNL